MEVERASVREQTQGVQSEPSGSRPNPKRATPQSRRHLSKRVMPDGLLARS